MASSVAKALALASSLAICQRRNGGENICMQLANSWRNVAMRKRRQRYERLQWQWRIIGVS